MKLPGTIILAAATEDFDSFLLFPLPGSATDAPERVSKSSASQTYGGGSRCFICADRATGKHYGASSCDGCKGFFRRSIRSNQTYNCRFNRQCVVDKDKRNQCRYCRLQKCFKAGMRKEAVQNERDCINPHRAKGQPVGTLSINVLLQAENSVQQSREISAKKTARVGDVFESMKQQLLLLVEWAKHIPEFCSLHIDDRVTLLRTHSAEHLILGAARRSLPYNDVILLGNDFVIPLRGAELEVSRVATRIQEELVKPLRELDITDKEFACLRAIVFFAPADCPGLEHPQLIRYLRLQAHVLLEEATCDQRGRLGELLLILPALQSISWQMVETLHLAKLLGEARLDSLLQEMLLGEGTATTQGQCAGSILNCERQNDLRPSPATFTSELPCFH
ncbi:hepatic nuclear factor 4, beta isoform X2 [Poecilia latipinna]|uniref:hepatic nuclear factor 4, beta isoform X1 n=1 Tax=Poecilia latipinna TaxID=48699 RepID=UPI00072EC61F|nr:PREDICTED: hepatocyte nuclear factor 4-beta-like isoform X1 [Poecilia latipinna]XP_014905130.1 PREDICTED: hepatocyte nuclear factor 4-beta-like isoform X2 [Poecilia latipinna]